MTSSRAPGFDRSRGFVVIGLQGLAPYRFEVEPALFITDDGDVSARLTATYEVLLTQRLILQPRLAFDAAVQAAEKFDVGRCEQCWARAALALRIQARVCTVRWHPLAEPVW